MLEDGITLVNAGIPNESSPRRGSERSSATEAAVPAMTAMSVAGNFG